jgi:hypothetical protein
MHAGPRCIVRPPYVEASVGACYKGAGHFAGRPDGSADGCEHSDWTLMLLGSSLIGYNIAPWADGNDETRPGGHHAESRYVRRSVTRSWVELWSSLSGWQRLVLCFIAAGIGRGPGVAVIFWYSTVMEPTTSSPVEHGPWDPGKRGCSH